jgi:hypothetical protein
MCAYKVCQRSQKPFFQAFRPHSVSYSVRHARKPPQERLKYRSPNILAHVDEVESVFVEYIRLLAPRTKTVGPHCLSIPLPQPVKAPIRIRLILEQSYKALVSGDGQSYELPPAFSPWIVSPRITLAPSSMIRPEPCVQYRAFPCYSRWPRS